MTLTKSQVERLGNRLVSSTPPAADDVAALHGLLLTYDRALSHAVGIVRSSLRLTPTSRIKSTGTILEKLDRYGGSWLKSIHDLAGMRIVGEFDRTAQDATVETIVGLFDRGRGSRRPKVIDRRANPSHGYRAVHVVVWIEAFPIEIQIRTPWQHEWAELFEKLADRIGRGIRYGEAPDHWLSPQERARLKAPEQALYALLYERRELVLRLALIIAETIDVVETAEQHYPQEPEVSTFKRDLARELDDLRTRLEGL